MGINLEKSAEEFATHNHTETNHTYNGRPYPLHLKMVVDVAQKFIHLIPEDKREFVIACCWCHDTISSARVTYEMLYEVFGEEFAEVVFALTKEKGRTPEDRTNDKYYRGIRAVKYAAFIRLCDRIADLQYSYTIRSSKSEFYKHDTPVMICEIYNDEYKEMFDYLETLSGIEHNN